MSARALRDLASPEVVALADRVLVVPIGATEQHGPHLPLSTDTDLAVELADAVARERDDVVVAPAIAFGSSGEHQAFPGTLSIGQDALLLLLVELGRSATETFRRVLLCSTHGGNAWPVRAAVELLQEEGRDVVAWSPRWGGDAHAGHVETSLMLALSPERVRAGKAPVGDLRPLRDVLPELRRAGVAGVSPNGVLGDARTADADSGRTLLRRATEDLSRTIAAWGAAPLPATGS